MRSSLSSSSSFALGLLLLSLSVGCAGTALGRVHAAERIPADGSLGGPGPDALKVQMIKPGEWAEAAPKKIAPTCDARASSPRADAAQMGDAKKVIDLWTEFRKAKPKPPPKEGVTVGDVAGIKRNITDSITALSFQCTPTAGGANTLDVNGTSHAFDLAWVLTNPEGSPPSVSIQALSLKDKKVVYASLKVPTDAEKAKDPKADAREVVVVANVSSYMPPELDEPLVRQNSGKYETLVFAKGATEGFYWIVPIEADLSVERYLGVGKFKVGEP